MQFGWRFDFQGGPIDGESDPPSIIITHREHDRDWDWAEVYEEPTPRVEKPQSEPEHWQVPPIVERMVELLNTHLKEQS